MIEVGSAEAAQRRRVAIVGGGTAGHVYPALAIAAAYQQAVPEVDLLFIGTPGGFEARLVPQRGYRIALVPGAPLYGVSLAGKLRAAVELVRGVTAARRLLRVHGTQLVIGLGGYASAGTLLAARSLGVRTVIHEANVLPGLTNRRLGRMVDRVYLGFDAATGVFPSGRCLVTGNPVRLEIAALSREPRSPPPGTGRPRHVLVTGGSQGARFLNQRVPDLLRRVAERGVAIEVQHQLGEAESEPVAAVYTRARVGACVTRYIDDMAAAYRWADFAVTRAGAMTIAELAVAGLPALLVPLPTASDDHQTANARAFADAGGGWCVRESEWNADVLAQRIAAVLSDADAWAATSRAAGRLAAPDAARAIVADCEAMVQGQ